MFKIAVIGCGHWGKNLVRVFSELNVLGAICDPHKETTNMLSKQYHVPALSWEKILENSAIQGVAIVAPASMHSQLVEQALEARKHVFVEKPLALRAEEGKKLCSLANKHDRRLMIGHLLQYHPAFTELKKMVHLGKLGIIKYIHATRLSFGRIRNEEDVLWDFAPHDISMILALMKEMPSKISAVGGDPDSQVLTHTSVMHMLFPGGAEAHVHVSWLHPFKEQRLVVVGERGVAVFDDTKPWESKLQWYPQRPEWRDGFPLPARIEPVSIPVPYAEPLSEECRHFIDCIQFEKTPRTDGYEGLQVLQIIEQAVKASQSTVAKSAYGKAIHTTEEKELDVITSP